jgi:hypothetical protein
MILFRQVLFAILLHSAIFAEASSALRRRKAQESARRAQILRRRKAQESAGSKRPTDGQTGGEHQQPSLSSLPLELRLRVFDNISPEVLMNTICIAKSFNPFEFPIILEYFVKRCEMTALLGDFFQATHQHGRAQMAEFVSRFFLNSNTGDVRFQYDDFEQPRRIQQDGVERRFALAEQDFRKIIKIRDVAKHYLDFLGLEWFEGVRLHSETANRISQMHPNDFLKHLRTWFSPAGEHSEDTYIPLIIRGLTSSEFVQPIVDFQQITPPMFFNYFFAHKDSKDVIPVKMMFANFKSCLHDLNHPMVPRWTVVDPIGIPHHPNGRAMTQADNGLFIDGTEIKFESGQAHMLGQFFIFFLRDADGALIKDEETQALYELDQGHSPVSPRFQTVTMYLARSG